MGQDFTDLEKQKDEELARLRRRHAELESMARSRQATYSREAGQLKDLLDRALKNLESAFSSKEADIRGGLDQSQERLQSLEERLIEIGKEADVEPLEKKIRSLEQSFLADVNAPKVSEIPEKFSKDLGVIRRESETRLAAKNAEINTLQERLAVLEAQTAKQAELFERERERLMGEGRRMLEKRETELRTTLSDLDREMAKRRLRIEEMEKLISARETWMEREKSERLERIKSSVEELDKNARLMAEKLEQERVFWQTQIKEVTQESETLSGKLAASDMQLQALKANHRDNLKAVTAELKKDLEKREIAARTELDQWKARLREANGKIQEAAGRMEGLKRSYQKELDEIQAQSMERRKTLLNSISGKEAEMERLRESSAAEMARRMAEINALRLDYERKVLTPVLEEKGRYLKELEAQKKALEEAMGQEEAVHRRETGIIAQECQQAEAKIAEFEKVLSNESRAHQERMRHLQEEASQVLAPLNEKMGQMDKALELSRKKVSEEIERLDREKSNIKIDIDHKKLSYESAAEEKRKELLFNLQNLKATREGQIARWNKEKEDLERNAAHMRQQMQKIQTELEQHQRNHEKNTGERQAQMEQLQVKLLQDIEKRKEEIQKINAEGEAKADLLRKEIDVLKKEGEGRLQALAKSWETEEVEMENKRISLLQEINQVSEANTRDKAVLEGQASDLQSQLSALLQREKDENERWARIWDQFEKKRASIIDPLEKGLNDAERMKSEVKARSKFKFDELDSEMKALKTDWEQRRQAHSKEFECRKEALQEATEELQSKQKKQQVEFQQALARLNEEAKTRNHEIAQKQAEIEKVNNAHQNRMKIQEAAFEQDRKGLEEALEASRTDLAKLRLEMESREGAQIKELDRIEKDLKEGEESHKKKMIEMEDKKRQEIVSLEGKHSAHISALQREIQELEAANEASSTHIKEMGMEVDLLKNRHEMELSDLERQKRRLTYDLRAKRNELSRELRLTRRAYQDKSREQEHNLYLARLKMQVRAKRIKETLEFKKQELSSLTEAAALSLAQTLKTLEGQAAALKQKRAQIEKQEKALEGQKQSSKSLSADREQMLKGLEREKEAMRQKAKTKLDGFVARMEELISSKEAERVAILKTLEQMGPAGETLQRSLTGLIMDWEREMRRIENLIKGIEESPFWRQP